MPRIEVGGFTTTQFLNPSTTTGPVYAVGDQVGSPVFFTPEQSTNNFRGAIIDSVSLIHKEASVTAQLDLFVITTLSTPTSTDSNPLDISDAVAQFTALQIGRFPITGWKSFASNSTNTLTGIKVPVLSGSASSPGSLQFVLKLSGGSLSFATTSSLVYVVSLRTT